MSPSLDVVVVAFNSACSLRRSLAATKRIAGVDRIMVVNNGPDESSAVAVEFGAEVVERPDNPGFGTGQNLGVERSRAAYILLLNPDAEPEPSGVAAGVVWLSEHDDVAAVQGVVTNVWDGRVERSQGRELAPVHLLGRAFGLKGLLRIDAVAALSRRVAWLSDHVERVPDKPTDVESFAATALLVRRAAFCSVRGFDERYFLYGEDLDLCRRLRAEGWRLVALPYPWARHMSGESSTSWFERELRWWQGTLQFAANWWRPAPWYVALASATAQWTRMAVNCPRRAAEAWRIMIVGAVRCRERARSTLS